MARYGSRRQGARRGGCGQEEGVAGQVVGLQVPGQRQMETERVGQSWGLRESLFAPLSVLLPLQTATDGWTEMAIILLMLSLFK